MDASTRIPIRNTFVHPDYDSIKNTNDIALVKLGRPTTTIPICILSSDPFDIPTAQLPISFKLNIPDVNHSTQHSREIVQVIDSEVCQRKLNMYQIDLNLTEGQVCSISTDGIHNFYETFNLGSVLYLKKESFDGQYYLTAISTFGFMGNVSDFNTVFMNVAYYSKWIQESLAQYL